MKRKGYREIREHFVILSTILILVAGYLIATVQSNHASETVGSKVKLASNSKTDLPVIPPIDKVAPSTLETASFGLG